MKKHIYVVLFAIAAAILVGCSSDDGGTSGGSGEATITRMNGETIRVSDIPRELARRESSIPRSVELCGTYPGTQEGGGATLTVDENCRFRYSSPDGNAEGRVVAVGSNSTIYDGCITSGEYAGECGRIRVHGDGRVTLE